MRRLAPAISDAEDVAGIVTKTGNCAAHETTSGFGGDTEAFTDFTEALALSVKKPEASFNGVPCPRLKGAKQFSEEVAFDTTITASSGVGSPLAIRSPRVTSPSSPTVLSRLTGVVRRCNSAFV